MNKVIIKYKGMLHPDVRAEVEERLERDIKNKGFILLDEQFDVFVVEADDSIEIQMDHEALIERMLQQ